MTNKKLIIKQCILKGACATEVKAFYDPFASFYLLPIVKLEDASPLLLVDGSVRWASHSAHVSYKNTRKMYRQEYALDLEEDFVLQFHLIQQKNNNKKNWQAVRQQFQEKVEGQLSTTNFESYPLAQIPVAWRQLTEEEYDDPKLSITFNKE